MISTSEQASEYYCVLYWVEDLCSRIRWHLALQYIDTHLRNILVGTPVTYVPCMAFYESIFCGNSHSQIQNVEPLYITRRSILQYLLITSMGMDFIPMLVTTSMGMKSIPMLVVKIYSISWMEYWKINNLIWIYRSFWLKNFRIYLKKNVKKWICLGSNSRRRDSSAQTPSTLPIEEYKRIFIFCMLKSHFWWNSKNLKSIFWFTFWIWECYSHIADFEYRQIPLVVKVITCVVLGLSLVASPLVIIPILHSWLP